MAIDRSKFKATNVAKAVEADQEIATSLGKTRGGFTGYIKLEDGANVIRIYPPHPEEDGGGEVFAEPKVTAFLPMMVVERDQQGQEIIENGRPKLKEGKKSVFNSRIHGNTEKDLVEEYRRLGLERLEEQKAETQDKVKLAQIDAKIESIIGNYGKQIQGLNYMSKWAMYVDRIVGQTATFGTLEIGAAVKERLNSLAASADAPDKALVTDPFTDVEEGRAVIITYNSQAKKAQDYYKTELDQTMVKQEIAGRTYPIPRMFPLSDEQLEVFLKAEPLAKRFKNVFTRRDFNLQFEGLQFFDEKYGIGLFQDDEFIAICEEIDAYYPEEEEINTEAANQEDETTSDVAADVVSEDEEDTDMFDMMDRKELSDWHKINKTGFLVKPTLKDEAIREAAREWVSSQERFEEEKVEDHEPAEKEDVVEETPTTTTKTTTLSRIEQMRLKAGSK